MTFTHNKEDNIHVARFGQEPAASHRESVADVLSRARERHGQDLRSVAQVLRIRLVYLEALESGETHKLPGTAYALGFLRTYAEYLGLNANNIIDRFKEEVQATDRPTELIFPEPVIEGRIPGGAIILISVSLLMVAYGGWFYLTHQGRTIADLVPEMPEQLQALLDSDTADTAPVEPQAARVSEAASAARISEAASAAGVSEAAPAAKVTQTAAVTAKEPKAAPDPAPAKVEAEPSVAATPVESAPAPAKIETVAVPEKTEPAPQVQEQAAEPLETPQAAVQAQAETAPATFPGPPITPGPAPELIVLTRDTMVPLAPEPASAVVTPAQTHPIEPQDSVESAIQQTVVIPAPPAAPKDFSQFGERTPRVYGEGNAGARIVLRALQDSWVQVRDDRDALLLTRVLRSGDVYHVPDQQGLTLLTGNAGGIQLEVDGVRLAPLGPIGAVRRQIALDPSRLLTGNTQ